MESAGDGRDECVSGLHVGTVCYVACSCGVYGTFRLCDCTSKAMHSPSTEQVAGPRPSVSRGSQVHEGTDGQGRDLNGPLRFRTIGLLTLCQVSTQVPRDSLQVQV